MDKFVDIKKILSNCIEALKLRNDELHFKINYIYDGNMILRFKLNRSQIIDINSLNKRLDLSLKMISRTKMKCVFFGKTSNGKSAVINAILGEKVLPSCFGRTTSCFINVEGCTERIGYFYDKDGKPDKLSLDYLEGVATENEGDKDGIDSMIKLFWPIHRCELLRYDVQLLDSPGVDISAQNDVWINKYCQDADIFVYVVDAGSTVCDSEKKFFKEVKSQIGNPNLFVLFNKWDKCEESSTSAELGKIKQQHLDTIQAFHTNLGIEYDQGKKVFFVSAKQSHRDAFKLFVQSLSREMSKRAVVTKFERHAINGCDGITMVTGIINTMMDKKNSDSFSDIAMEVIIENLIDNTFGTIEKDSLHQILQECKSCASSISKGIDRGTTSCDTISTMIKYQFDLLIKNLKSNIGTILPKIRSDFKSFAPVVIDDELMDKYIPNSFEEVLKKYQKKVPKGIANEEIQSAYNDLNEYIRPTSYFGNVRTYTTSYGPILGLGVFALQSLFGFISGAVNSIFGSTIDLFKEHDMKSKLEKCLCDSIFNYLEKVVKDIIKESRDDISDIIGDMRQIFVRDCGEVRQFMDYLDELGDDMDVLYEEILIEKVKIWSMKD